MTTLDFLCIFLRSAHGRSGGHLHVCKAQHSSSGGIASAEDFQHRPWWSGGRLGYFCGVHERWVERLAKTRNLLHVQTTQQVIEPLPRQQVALNYGFQHWPLGKSCKPDGKSRKPTLRFFDSTHEPVAHIE